VKHLLTGALGFGVLVKNTQNKRISMSLSEQVLQHFSNRGAWRTVAYLSQFMKETGATGFVTFMSKFDSDLNTCAPHRDRFSEEWNRVVVGFSDTQDCLTLSATQSLHNPKTCLEIPLPPVGAYSAGHHALCKRGYHSFSTNSKRVGFIFTLKNNSTLHIYFRDLLLILNDLFTHSVIFNLQLTPR
jgi:hypothetical protein